MSIGRILLGIGGVGVTAIGTWFGMAKKQENDNYQIKMTKYRTTAKKVNGYLEANGEGERVRGYLIPNTEFEIRNLSLMNLRIDLVDYNIFL